MNARELAEKVALLAPREALPVVVILHDKAGVFMELPVVAISLDGRRVSLHCSERDAAF